MVEILNSLPGPVVNEMQHTSNDTRRGYYNYVKLLILTFSSVTHVS